VNVFRICLLVTIASIALLVLRCRRCPDLTAHYWPCDYDRFALGGCQPCDPRLDELQEWATYYERG